MANLRDKINVDIDNIDRVFAELPEHSVLPKLSILELAGVATLLHNFYNGVENILKRILLKKGISTPLGNAWHKDLLNLSEQEKIISPKVKIQLGEFLAFRHFFSNAYAINNDKRSCRCIEKRKVHLPGMFVVLMLLVAALT